MQLTDPMRRSIVAKLDGLLDLEEAEAMIADIPRDWPPDIVTAQILDLRLGETEARFRTEIADVRTEIAGVRTEIAGVRTEIADVRTEIATLAGRVDTRFAEVEGRIDTRFAEAEGRADARFAEAEGRADARFAEAEGRIDTRFAEADARFATLEARIEAVPDAVIRQLLFWLIPVILTAIGVSVALARMVG
jgi:hypothetical protein